MDPSAGWSCSVGGMLGCCDCDELMDPSAGWSRSPVVLLWCCGCGESWVLLGVRVGVAAQQDCTAAVAVVNPWFPVLDDAAAQQGCWGDVAVVNPWILVLVGVAA